MTRSQGQDRCVECGAPASHRMVCPVHAPLYANDNRAPVSFIDDLDPAARDPKEYL